MKLLQLIKEVIHAKVINVETILISCKFLRIIGEHCQHFTKCWHFTSFLPWFIFALENVVLGDACANCNINYLDVLIHGRDSLLPHFNGKNRESKGDI